MVPLVLVEIGGGSVCVSACSTAELLNLATALDELLHEVKRYAWICMYTGNNNPHAWKVLTVLVPGHFKGIDPIPIIQLSDSSLQCDTVSSIIEVYRHRLGCNQLSIAVFSTRLLDGRTVRSCIGVEYDMAVKTIHLRDCRTPSECTAQLRLLKHHARYIFLSTEYIRASVQRDNRGIPSYIVYKTPPRHNRHRKKYINDTTRY